MGKEDPVDYLIANQLEHGDKVFEFLQTHFRPNEPTTVAVQVIISLY